MLLPTEVGDEMSAGFHPAGRSAATSAATAFRDGGRKLTAALQSTQMAACAPSRLTCLMGWTMWQEILLGTVVSMQRRCAFRLGILLRPAQFFFYGLVLPRTAANRDAAAGGNP